MEKLLSKFVQGNSNILLSTNNTSNKSYKLSYTVNQSFTNSFVYIDVSIQIIRTSIYIYRPLTFNFLKSLVLTQKNLGNQIMKLKKVTNTLNKEVG